jgi:ABC-type nitrate/sulfonate/bicarbonate transport system substrate-binding protein
MRSVAVVVAGCLFLLLTGETSAAEKIRVGFVSPAPGLSAPWIAKETGGFARNGLDADVILLPGSPRLVQSLIAGDVHYALVGAAAVMRARMRGGDVVIIGAATNVSSQKLVVNPKSGIRKLEDLKGRVIGVSQYGSDADGFARAALAKGGLKPEKDVAILQLGGHPQVAAALVAGKLDAGILGGLALVTAQKSGAVVLTSAIKLETVSLGPVLSVTRQYAQQNRDGVTRFMRAFAEAIQYFKKNPNDTIPILQKMMGGIGAESARILYEEYVELFEELPVPQEKGLQAILDQETDPKTKSFKPGDFVDLSFLRQIDQEGAVERIYRK